MVIDALDAIVLMGYDPYGPSEAKRIIEEKRRKDSEIYLYGINKYDIYLWDDKQRKSVSVGARFFRGFDDGTLIRSTAVVGDIRVRQKLHEYLDRTKGDYAEVPQEDTKIQNVEKALAVLKSTKVLITGADIPQARFIDARIVEIGTGGVLNMALGRAEALGSFWRSPFFINCNGKHQAYKESQDYILDPRKIKWDIVRKFDMNTKFAGLIPQLILGGKLVKVAYQNMEFWTATSVIYNFLKLGAAYLEFNSRLHHAETYPWLQGGKMERFKKGFSEAMDIPIPQINIRESGNAPYYMDLDSAQDAYRHEAILLFGQNIRFTHKLLRELDPLIIYDHQPLVERLGIEREPFYADLMQKQEQMARFTGTTLN